MLVPLRIALVGLGKILTPTIESLSSGFDRVSQRPQGEGLANYTLRITPIMEYFSPVNDVFRIE
jgi:hypothetical protein